METAVTYRSSYGDDPVKKSYYNGADPTAIAKAFNILTFGNSLWRNYGYSYFTGCWDDEKGHHHGASSSGSGTVSDWFSPPSVDPVKITTKIYNGKSIPVRTFEPKSQGSTGELYKRLEWGSRPIEIPVHRWMKNLDKDGNVKDYIMAAGKYPRVFRYVNTADISFQNVITLKKWFNTDITNARNLKVGAANYPHAPFATDRVLTNEYDYPFKAGYYLNPGGQYAVTIKTVTYQNGGDYSGEHSNLVNKAVSAFRHKSNLQYSHYADGSGKYSLDYPTNNNALITYQKSATQKAAEKLKYSVYSDPAETDDLFKLGLEGWEQSGTADSFNNYKYREFVTDSNVHRVTETTTVTFYVNPDNQKRYTRRQMPDGDYWIKAWFEGVNYNDLNYGYKGKNYFTPLWMNGVSALDMINIRVQGVMDDDLGNVEEQE